MNGNVHDHWNCKACGEDHYFDEYTVAHWDVAVTRICPCGQRHILCNGIVEATD